MKVRWFFLPIVFILVLSLLVLFAVSSMYPEKFAFYIVQKVVGRSGGILTVGSFQGNIKRGLRLEKVSFHNDSVHIESKAVTLRLRTTPLLFGVFWLKQLKVEGAEIKLTSAGQGAKDRGSQIPLWLTVYSKKTSIEIDRLEIDGKDTGPVILEHLKLEAHATVRLGNLNFRALRLDVGGSPLGQPFSFSGSLGFRPSRWLNCDGSFATGRSKGQISARYKLTGGRLVLDAGLDKAELFLKDFKAAADFPDLHLTCSAKASLVDRQIKIKADVEEKGYGKFSLDSEAEIGEGTIKGRGDVRADPFYYSLGIPQIRSDRLKICGDFKAGFEYGVKEKRLKCSLEGKIRESEILNIPIDSGDASLTVDGSYMKVVSTFSSRLAGKGSVEIDHDFGSFLTSVDFSTSGTLSKSTVDALGIEIPLPYPLVFSENVMAIKSGDLLFDGDNVNIRISAKDQKDGEYRVNCFFRDLSIFDLSLGLSKIEPGLWGFKTPFRFSGDLDFNFTEPGFTPAKLGQGYFEFEKGTLGPVATGFKILPTGKLLFPPTLVPFAGGSAEIQGELSEDGSYKGDGTAALASWDIAPEKIRSGMKGSLSSEFSFEGDFSKIKLAGAVKSPSVEFSGWKAEELAIEGSVNLEPGNTSLRLGCSSGHISSGSLSAGPLSVKLDGRPESLKFDLASAAGEGRSITFGGVMSFAGGGFSSTIERGALKTGAKNLYFSGTPRIDIDREMVRWSGFSLLSGESKLESEGSVSLSNVPRAVDARLSAENFSLILLPLPGELSALRGKIDGEVTIKGTLDRPDLEGGLLFKNLTFPLKESDFRIVGMADLKFNKDVVNFSNCYFSTNDGGDCTLTGSVKLDGFYPRTLGLSLDAQDFPVIYGKDFQGLIDIGLKLTGSYDEPRVEGSIHFLKGKLQLPEAAKNPALPSSITFKNQKGPIDRISADEDPLLKKLRGSVLFTSKGKLWISRNDMVGELGGRVLLRFTNDGIVPEGNLTILSGRFLLQGSKFELKDSSLYFSSGRDLYPILDIKASKDIGDYEVIVRLQGHVEKPTLSLSSIPQLDEGEVLSLILFGRPSQNLSPEEHARWGGAAAAIAFNYEATPIIRSVSKALKVDTLLVGTSSVGDPQLGFSKYLSDRFVLEYEQVFGSLPESRVNLRYRINRHLSVDTISSTAGKSGADVTWEQKY